MSFDPNVWNQLRGLTADELVRALLKDKWEHDTTTGAVQVYKKGEKRITIHYHPNKQYGPGLLKGLLSDIGWTVEEMRKLKLVK